MPREKAVVSNKADDAELIQADRRHPYYINGDITQIGMPPMRFEGGELPSEQYFVPEDRVILVHPAHETLIVQIGGRPHHYPLEA